MKIKKSFLISGLAALLCGALGVVAFPSVTQAAPNQFDGNIYWDQNNNGTKDLGEPGVEGVLVSYDSVKTITDANGNYTLTGVSGNTDDLIVAAGWYRSACNSLNCAAGTPGGNDFPVVNQFIMIQNADADTGGTFNTGMVPGWSGTYPIVNGPGVPVDAAARLTYGQGCSLGTGAQRLCGPGSTIRFRAAFLNQGTAEISNPIFTLSLPLGHTPTGAWFDNDWAIPGADTVTTLIPFNPALGYGVYRLDGVIPAGASSAMFINVSVDASAVGSPTPYATADPRDKMAVLQILGLDQTGDPDSDYCVNAAQDWKNATCALNPLGDHDKTIQTDSTDGATWNVTGTFVARTDSVAVSLTDPASPIMVCEGTPSSGTVTSTLTIANNSTGDTPVRNVEIVIDVPTGLTFTLADNPGWFMGGDGKPHTFINLPILPGGSVDVPVVFGVRSTVTAADNGTPALRVTSRIVAYDTGQVTVQPDGSSEFNAGSLAGSLTSTVNVTAQEADNCPVATTGGTLAKTGIHQLVPAIVAGGLVSAGGAMAVGLRKRK